MKKILKSFVIAILVILAATLIVLPIEYLYYKVAGLIGKIIIITVLFILLWLCIWYGTKEKVKLIKNKTYEEVYISYYTVSLLSWMY